MEMTQKGGKSMRGVSKFLPVAFAAGGLGVTAATGAGMDGYVERMDKAAKRGVFHASQDAVGCRRLMTAKCAERGEAG
ncbi:hypothetical protein WN944_003198 [Citrus x changshan-huyou]|uniref:Uncharacterized protein n=1 Tax=Citrus x changshan-huyou TaxID=2935761 RepID=A0AAP0LZ12_9ROSI